MVDTIAQVHHDLDGIGSPVLLIFDPDNTDAALNNSGSGDSMTKATNREASWRATISESLAGVYAYEVRSGSVLIASGFIHLLNDTNTHYGVDSYADAALSSMLEEDFSVHRLTRNALEQGGSVIASGVAQGGTASTVQLAASENFGDDVLNGAIFKITGGTGAGQHRVITDYVGSTDTATVTPDFVVTPDEFSEYEVVVGMADVKAIEGGDATDAIQNALTSAITCHVMLNHDDSGDVCDIGVWLMQSGELIDPTTLHANSSVTVDVRQLDAGADLFSVSGDQDDLSNNVWRLTQNSPNFATRKLYRATATVTIDGTDYVGDKVFPTW